MLEGGGGKLSEAGFAELGGTSGGDAQLRKVGEGAVQRQTAVEKHRPAADTRGCHQAVDELAGAALHQPQRLPVVARQQPHDGVQHVGRKRQEAAPGQPWPPGLRHSGPGSRWAVKGVGAVNGAVRAPRLLVPRLLPAALPRPAITPPRRAWGGVGRACPCLSRATCPTCLPPARCCPPRDAARTLRPPGPARTHARRSCPQQQQAAWQRGRPGS
jgi:hypothetical protein